MQSRSKQRHRPFFPTLLEADPQQQHHLIDKLGAFTCWDRKVVHVKSLSSMSSYMRVCYGHLQSFPSPSLGSNAATFVMLWRPENVRVRWSKMKGKKEASWVVQVPSDWKHWWTVVKWSWIVIGKQIPFCVIISCFCGIVIAMHLLSSQNCLPKTHRCYCATPTL